MPTAEAIGIDTGINTTALSVRYASGEEWVETICRPKPRGDLLQAYSAQMIHSVRNATFARANPAPGKLLVVATERLFLQGDNAHSLSLEWAVISGVVGKLIDRAGRGMEDLRVVICRPACSQLKKFVTGDGSIQKHGVGRFMERNWPQAPEEENAAESYALMQFARCRRQYELGLIERESGGDFGEWYKYQIDLATRDLWSDAKTGVLHTITITGEEALALAKDFREGAYSGETLIEQAAEVAG